MSDYQPRNQPFDYTPPARSGSGAGALFLIGGIIVLFLLAMLFLGGTGSGTLPEDGAVAPADGAPVAVETAPTIGTVDGAEAPLIAE